MHIMGDLLNIGRGPIMAAKLDTTKLSLDQLPAHGFTRAAQLLKFLPFGRSTLWAWSADGRFVKPVSIGAITCWENEKVHAWLADHASSKATNVMEG